MLRRRLTLEPCLPRPAKEPPAGPGWIHEIKHDGFRILTRRDAIGVRLFTRNGYDFTARFPKIVEAVASLGVRSCVIDGEAVVVDERGLSVFDALRYRLCDHAAVLCAFDLIELDGENLRGARLENRKRTLAALLRDTEDGIAFNKHFDGDGAIIYKHTCALGCEGPAQKGAIVLTKIECILCENVFGRYCVPKSSQHRPAAQTVLRGEVWELDTLNFIRDRAGNGDIIHAGTYFGDFLPALSTAISSGRTIYGFEPNPENYASAEWTTALNCLTNIRLYNAGLGAERKQASLRTISNDGRVLGGASYIVEERDIGDGLLPISLLSIDTTIPLSSHVSIIQLDVEGYEAIALLGAIQTIRRCRPTIIVETVPTAFVKDYLTPLGYSLNGTSDGNTIFAVPAYA